MNDLIPLATLSELGSVDQLTCQLGDDVQIDDIGRRCCTRERARRLFTERTAALAEQARRHEEWQQRYAEQSARIRATIGKGIPAVSGDAYVDMIGAYER